MKRAILVALGTGTAITSVAAISIGASLSPELQTLARSEYEAALAGIEAARELVLARCEDSVGTGKELCRAEAGADEMVRVADLEARYRGNRDSARGSQRARIEARYVIDKAKCTTLGGLKRDQCQIKAHAMRGRALLEAAAPYSTRS